MNIQIYISAKDVENFKNYQTVVAYSTPVTHDLFKLWVDIKDVDIRFNTEHTVTIKRYTSGNTGPK